MKNFSSYSLTARLTLLFALVTTSVLLLLGAIIGKLVEQHFRELDRNLLEGKFLVARHLLEATRSDADLKGLPHRLEDGFVGHDGLSLVIRRTDGKEIFHFQGSVFPADMLSAADTKLHEWETIDGQHFRGISRSVQTTLEGYPSVSVALATNLEHHKHFMDEFQQALWLIVTMVAVLAGLLGWWAARRGLSPLRSIAQQTSAITASKLDQRLPDNAIPAELTEVVQTFNEMLARLEEAFRRLSDFSADIAHELRTPVNNLLVQSQVTLAKARSAAEYEDIVASNVEELERLSRMIADMLFLAKADHALLIPHNENVALKVEAQAVLDFYEALAADKRIVATCEGDAIVNGDRLMLRRAISNLVSNAVRHTQQGGRLSIEIRNTNDQQVELSVINTGSTIPSEHLPRLFDRFYRAGASRQRVTEGAGLGLAITRSIMAAHGGELSVVSEGDVTTFTLRLPAVRA